MSWARAGGTQTGQHRPGTSRACFEAGRWGAGVAWKHGGSLRKPSVVGTQQLCSRSQAKDPGAGGGQWPLPKGRVGWSSCLSETCLEAHLQRPVCLRLPSPPAPEPKHKPQWGRRKGVHLPSAPGLRAHLFTSAPREKALLSGPPSCGGCWGHTQRAQTVRGAHTYATVHSAHPKSSLPWSL